MDFDSKDISHNKDYLSYFDNSKHGVVREYEGNKDLRAMNEVNIFINDVYESHFNAVEKKIEDSMAQLSYLRNATKDLVDKSEGIPFHGNNFVGLYAYYNEADALLIEAREKMKRAHKLADKIYDKGFHGNPEDSKISLALFNRPKGGGGGGK
jgi:cellobiose-specific phosphotransferase system component IIA